jgi:hypothetical protein
MRKQTLGTWILTALLIAAISAHWWVKPFLAFIKLQADIIKGINGGIQLLLWVSAALTFLFRSLHPGSRSKKVNEGKGSMAEIEKGPAGEKHVLKESPVQVIQIGEGARIDGDIVGRDKIILRDPEPSSSRPR